MLNTKILIGCFVMCTLLLVWSIVTTTLLAIGKTENSTECQSNQEAKCETFGCVKAAGQIVSYINESINPCENFYKFASGRYVTEMTNEGWKSHSLYDTVSEIMNRKIAQLLTEPSDSTEIHPVRLAKSFYESCGVREISKRQKTRILQSLGGWPVVEGELWSTSEFSLTELLIKVKQLGFGTDIIFETSIYVDPENKTDIWLRIKKGNYERDYTSDYQELMNEIPLQFVDENDDRTKERIAIEMKSVLETENELRYFKYNSDDSDSEGRIFVQTTTIEELRKSYPLDWLKYFNGILPSGLNLTENERIMNFDPEFFRALSTIFKSRRDIANYVIWRVMYKLHQMETVEMCDDNISCCVKMTSEKFAIPVTVLYSLKYFNETSRQAAVALVEDVRHAFIDLIRNATWMENWTRQRAIEKAENIVAHVSYPNDKIDAVVEYYKDLEMKSSDSFFDKLMRWNVFNQNQMFKALRKPANRMGVESMLQLKPNKANAFYSLRNNAIRKARNEVIINDRPHFTDFPIAILHELFFALDRPQYINYASLGNTVGHEITHGFDSTGRKYDLNGNLVDWWDANTEVTFLNRSECFVEQYSNFVDEITKLKIDGAQTNDENIADNGGTIAAYYAYQNWMERNGPEELVPGIKYNQRQLFWIAYAQAESSVSGKSNLIDQILYGEHATDEFRVNGVVANSPEFATDFGCAVGSTMNPEQKCKIW